LGTGEFNPGHISGVIVTRENNEMNYRYIDSPIGHLLLAGNKPRLKMIGFPSGKGRVTPDPDWIEDLHCFTEAKKQLGEYFSGERLTFELELEPKGTPFQIAVLDALVQIPYGETRSYRDIAIEIGKPRAARAVGAANGRNPLPIVIPCHRVIGANGSLTGFGGGLEAKTFLLELERKP
jgi:methylated-DNA-[protein]-cysteine S-methyltransferase